MAARCRRSSSRRRTSRGRTLGGDATVACGRCLRNPSLSRLILADSRNSGMPPMTLAPDGATGALAGRFAADLRAAATSRSSKTSGQVRSSGKPKKFVQRRKSAAPGRPARINSRAGNALRNDRNVGHEIGYLCEIITRYSTRYSRYMGDTCEIYTYGCTTGGYVTSSLLLLRSLLLLLLLLAAAAAAAAAHGGGVAGGPAITPSSQ